MTLYSAANSLKTGSTPLISPLRPARRRAFPWTPENGKRAFLLVGNEDWPFPVPLVKRGGKWFFDSKAGRQELLYRRIGANELDAIEICHGYVEAQDDYATQKRALYDVNQYAQRIVSTPGKQDGLAWQNPDGTWGGPVGENIARAIEQGYTSSSEPYHGYFFKILKGQGPAAPLGEMNFVVKGIMIGGFALVAAPAEYDVTGVRTFIVSHDGVVYEKDFGPTTSTNLRRWNASTLTNPGPRWPKSRNSGGVRLFETPPTRLLADTPRRNDSAACDQIFFFSKTRPLG